MLIFEAWDPIVKARKAKGLENWKRLEHVADRLTGKKMSDITFTSSHPMYNGEKVKHTLGSTTGNMHFLMGYVNPGFHVAPYHWQIIDPYLTDEEVAGKQHPARPDLWKQSGLPTEPEGDQTSGEPHPTFKKVQKQQSDAMSIKREAVFAKAGYGRYIGIPSMGIVFCPLNKKMYSWDIVRGSFLSATNKRFYEEMEAAKSESLDAQEFIDKSVNQYVLNEALKHVGKSLSEDAYAIVRQVMPAPGSIIDMDTAYGIVTDSSVMFMSKSTGNPLQVEVFDKSINSLNFTGEQHPSVVLNFLEEYLDVSRSSIEGVVHKSSNNFETVVNGEATANSENWDFAKPSTHREIARIDGVSKVVSRV